MSSRTQDSRRRTPTRLRWVVAGLLALFVAYVGGRAAGILLDLNPYVTEIAAMVTVGMVAVWAAARRRD